MDKRETKWIAINERGETYGLEGSDREKQERKAALLNRRASEGHPYFAGPTAIYHGTRWTVAVVG